MQTIRSNLTRLSNAIEDKLPEGNDLFGFSGISKELITTFINESYQLSYKLDELEPNFEITILKRKISPLIDSCKQFLAKDIDRTFSKEKYFDEFLTNLTRIREEIRLAYLVVVDKALRTEIETQQILEDFHSMRDTYTEYEEQFTLIEDKLNRVKDSDTFAEEHTSRIQSFFTESDAACRKIQSLQAETESSYEITTKYESEIKERKQAAIDLGAQLSSMEKKAKSLNSKAESNRHEFEKLKEELENQIALNNKQQKEIQDTLENANRVGMAGSFKLRKEELNTPLKMWGFVFGIAVVIIFAIGYHFVGPFVAGEEGKVDSLEIGLKIALVFPFVWLAWMSAKQYGYLARIREDYAYKFASAMAFEGYKKHAIEIDEDLLKQLMEVSVVNLSQNPIRLFSTKDNHASPINEMAKEILNRAKDVKTTATDAVKKEVIE